jgi:hypothetical protein
MDMLRLVFPPADTLITGFAFKHDGGGMVAVSNSLSSATAMLILQSLGSTQFWLRLNPDRTVSAMIGTDSGTSVVLGTSSVALADATYHYIEVKIFVHASSGTLEVRKNGSAIIGPLTNQDTFHAASTLNNIILGRGGQSSSSSLMFWYDDFYLLDGSGSTSNTFLNDVRVDVMFPNAEGNTTQWTPSAGTDNSANVDESQFNADTDYNSSSTVNDKDTLAFPSAPVANTNYHAVQLNMMARKEEAGPGGLKGVIRLGGTDYLSAELPLTSDYTDVRTIFDRRPSDNGVWTASDIDGAEFGYQKSS